VQAASSPSFFIKTSFKEEQPRVAAVLENSSSLWLLPQRNGFPCHPLRALSTPEKEVGARDLLKNIFLVL